MLIETKAKIVQTIDNKVIKKVKTFIVDRDLLAQAEYDISTVLSSDPTINDFEILSIKQSNIKEVYTQFSGDYTYIATLKDIYHDDSGKEKSLRYKILLWANNLPEATHNAWELHMEGYDMQVESIKEVDYEYIVNNGQD